jgi:signal transduction histidine kinase
MEPAFRYSPYVWPMLLAAIAAGAMAVYALRRRRVPGALAFALQVGCVAIWATASAVQVLARPDLKPLSHVIRIGAAFTAVAAVTVFSVERVHPEGHAARRTARAMRVLVPALWLFLATNSLHGLMWTRLWYDQVARSVELERGPLNAPTVLVVIGLTVASLVMFLRLAVRSRGVARRQGLLLFFGTLPPLVAAAAELARIRPLAPLDTVILTWVLSGSLYALAIFRYGMLGVIPVGRNAAIERMSSGVLVLDAEDRIADLNPAAAALLSVSRSATTGLPAAQVLAGLGAPTDLLRASPEAGIALSLQCQGEERHYRLQAFPLRDSSELHIGRLLLLRDDTEQRRAEARVLEQERTLAALRERERLARELHDGLGQSLAAAQMQVGTAKALLAQGSASLLEACLDTLADTTLQASADVREYLLGVNMVTALDRPMLERLRDFLGGFGRQYGLPVDLSLPPDLEMPEFAPEFEFQLLRIVQEALSNVRKHAEAHSARVSFALAQGQFVVAVSDDGRGFDVAAAAALSDGYGLRSMRERAHVLGGNLAVVSSPGQGTCVTLTVPLKGETAA